MSQLQKRIQKFQRREGAGIGFSRVAREAPRALALLAVVSTADEAKAALEAGADAVAVEAASAGAAASAMIGIAEEKAAVGALLPSLSEGDAKTLQDAKCDFVISPLETTDSAAVDTDRMGQVVAAAAEMEDNVLRALGPLSLDGLFVKRGSGAMTLAQQLAFVRLASFASTGLIVTVDSTASIGELRVLRDSGTVAVSTAKGTSVEALKSLIETLKAVPPPRKGRREGADIALVPSASGHSDEHEEEEGGDE
jgi:hypothetical protein